ncbi:colicin E3/pyocin S6 family cytotoxin [Actinopolymorpha sp. B11F2]|uniref:colicin E3/pyocin S6 family cytotoxin n=1 Tax=Actinopolymorpha sp. B11F2 TaxID=3160862 RepID=UPI0032E44DAA
MPGLLYLVVGGFPATAWMQDAFTTTAGFIVLVVFGVGGTAWLAYRLWLSLRVARQLAGHPAGEVVAVTRLQVILAAGATITGVALLSGAATGRQPAGPLMSNVFLLDALQGAALALGIALTALALLSLIGGLGGPGLAFGIVGGRAIATAAAASGLTLAQAARIAGIGALAGAMLSEANGGSSTAGSSTGGASPQRQGQLPPGQHYHVPPRRLNAFPDAQPIRSKGPRRTWKDSQGNIYEFDRRHGTVEKYDRGNRHQGDFNVDTGKQVGPADPSRKPQGK